MSPKIIGTGAGEGDNAFGRSQGSGGLSVWQRDAEAVPFGVSRSPAGLHLWADVKPQTSGGWAVYTFKHDSAFTVTPGANILADVLLVGGGGSGGGGEYGGGGGAGGFVDKHDVLIYSSSASPPRDGGYPDGDIVVGAGGAAVSGSASTGNMGRSSLLGDELTAYGGGYGGRVAPDPDSYPASDGASGGGGRGNEIYVETVPDRIDIYTGIPGLATYNQTVPEGGDAKDYEQGHDGGPGTNTSAWGNHSAGGGGGSQWPAYDRPYSISGTRMTGGLGRPCDIGGWYQCPDHILNEMYREAGWPYVPWFAGGGAGKERANNWSYPDGGSGYGGGGECGEDGEAHTGGGAGGHGWFGDTPPGETGLCPGRAGGSGIVIVRIPLTYKKYVTAPLQLTDESGMPLFDEVWEPYNERWIQEPVYPHEVTYTEVPSSEPHIDHIGGMEPVFIWGRLTGEHGHRWGWVNEDFEG